MLNKYVLVLFWICWSLLDTPHVFARPNYYPIFMDHYGRPAFLKQPCLQCHIEKASPFHNDYGATVARLLGVQHAGSLELIIAIEAAEHEPSLIAGKSYGDLIRDKRLPSRQPEDQAELAPPVLPVALDAYLTVFEDDAELRLLVIAAANRRVAKRFDRDYWQENLTQPSAIATPSVLLAPPTNWQARQSLRKIDEHIVPTLVNAILGSDDTMRAASVEALSYVPGKVRDDVLQKAMSALGASLANSDNYIRREAIRAIGQMNELARGMVPALALAVNMDDTATRAEIARSLGRVGSKYVPPDVLIRLLRDTHRIVKYRAARAAAEGDFSDHRVLDALFERAKDQDGLVRHAALDAIVEIGLTNELDLKLLAQILMDNSSISIDHEGRQVFWNTKLAIEAAKLHGRKGRRAANNAKTLPDTIAKELGTADPRVRARALTDLIQNGGSSAGVVDKVIPLLNDHEVIDLKPELPRSNAMLARAALLGMRGDSTRKCGQYLSEKNSLLDKAVLIRILGEKHYDSPLVTKVLLEQLPNNTQQRYETERAILNLPYEYIAPIVSSEFTAESSERRRFAAEVIGNMGEWATPEVPKLVKLLDDAQESVRVAAIHSLVKLAPHAPNQLETLLDLKSYRIRFAVALAGNNNVDSRRIQLILAQTIATGELPDRLKAIEAMERYSECVQEVAAQLQQIFTLERDPTVRARLARCLILSGAPESFWDVALKDTEPAVREAAVFAVVRRGVAGSRRILKLANESTPRELQMAALECLDALDFTADDEGILRSFLTQPDDQLRRISATSLSNNHTAAKHGFSIWLDFARNADDEVMRLASIRALGNSGRRDKEVIDVFRTALTSKSVQLRLQAVDSLRRIGPMASPATSDLVLIVDNESNPDWLRISAINAVRDLGPAGYRAVPTLTATLDSENTAMVDAACVALASIGRHSSSATAKLATLAKKQTENRYLACALGQISNNNWTVPWEHMDARAVLPPFADPIPVFSDSSSVKALDLVPAHARISEIYSHTTLELDRQSYPLNLFGFRDGFAIATRFERFDPQSLMSSPDPIRWRYDKLRPQLFSKDSVRNFLFGQRGDFRAFVIVATRGPIQGQSAVKWRDVVNWQDWSSGALPVSIATVEADEFTCHVLVYHFRSLDGSNHVLQTRADGTPTVVDQLQAAKLKGIITK